MKYVFALALAFSALHAFAEEAVCHSNSNSELAIRLLFNANTMAQISWINRDWGAEGWGELQEVALTNHPNEYVVTEQHGSAMGFYKGALIQLKYEGTILKSAEVFANPNSPKQGETYRCN